MARAAVIRAVLGVLAVTRGAASEGEDSSAVQLGGEVTAGYATGELRYDGPTFDQANAPPVQRHYSGETAGVIVGASAAAAYRWHPRWAAGIRVGGALAPSPDYGQPIPGAGLDSYVVLGAGAFVRLNVLGGPGPTVELGAGYARATFTRNPDASFAPGWIAAGDAFESMSGFSGVVTVEYTVIQAPLRLSPKLGFQYLAFSGKTENVVLVIPVVGVSFAVEP